MPKASDFVETEATSQSEVPQASDTPAPQTPLCPICDKPVGERVVTTRIPVLMPDGMWGHVFRPAHPYCGHMWEQGL